jgi:hypothetical protein
LNQPSITFIRSGPIAMVADNSNGQNEPRKEFRIVRRDDLSHQLVVIAKSKRSVTFLNQTAQAAIRQPDLRQRRHRSSNVGALLGLLDGLWAFPHSFFDPDPLALENCKRAATQRPNGVMAFVLSKIVKVSAPRHSVPTLARQAVLKSHPGCGQRFLPLDSGPWCGPSGFSWPCLADPNLAVIEVPSNPGFPAARTATWNSRFAYLVSKILNYS